MYVNVQGYHFVAKLATDEIQIKMGDLGSA